ncbi:hypothetical protein HDU76_006862 [Blyttiomyces sp. JEL0837]|nr:hypothetical protein HDU76_006862 [Blyttiomyces sp. JEL0837]
MSFAVQSVARSLDTKGENFAATKRILFSSGNVIKSPTGFQHNAPSVELLAAIEDAAQLRPKTKRHNRVDYREDLSSSLVEIGTISPLSNEEIAVRDCLEITEFQETKTAIQESISLLRRYLSESIDTFVIHADDSQARSLKTIGELVSNLQNEGFIKRLGLSGLSTSCLEELLSHVHPEVLEVIELDGRLKDLSTQYGFEIRPSRDGQQQILSPSSLDVVASRHDLFPYPPNTLLSSDWVVRYTVYDKTRSVLLHKGFLVMATANSSI